VASGSPAVLHAGRPAPLPGDARLALKIIISHLLVNFFHGAAHFHFHIPMAMWQQAYIAVVIFVAPLVAGALLLQRRLRASAWLLLASMAGALLFGLNFHFLLVGPDHVASVDSRGWGLTFQLTAFLLGVLEAWGVSVSVRLLRAAKRQ
jgi:hypothetical protein